MFHELRMDRFHVSENIGKNDSDLWFDSIVENEKETIKF